MLCVGYVCLGCAGMVYCVHVCGQMGGKEGMFYATPAQSVGQCPRPPPVPHCGRLEAGASAGRTEGHLWVSPRVVYRTVYRQVVKTEYRMRLQCCQGFYESSGACVRESWVGPWNEWSLGHLVLPCPHQGGATPLLSAGPVVSRDKAATSYLCL